MLLLVVVTLLALTLLLGWLMRPKYFYIVRHGQTLMNQAHIKQGSEGGLSPKGMMQAEALGRALMPLRIRHIYTSPYERALQTATAIAQTSPAPITASPLLAERKSPSEVIGKPVADPEVMRITGLTEYGYHPDAYRFSDEENFEDLRSRAKECLLLLERSPYHANLVVTHHVFLQMLVAYMLYRDRLTASEYVKLSFFNPVENGGVAICSYSPVHNPFSSTRGWRVLGYNQVVQEEA